MSDFIFPGVDYQVALPVTPTAITLPGDAIVAIYEAGSAAGWSHRLQPPSDLPDAVMREELGDMAPAPTGDALVDSAALWQEFLLAAATDAAEGECTPLIDDEDAAKAFAKGLVEHPEHWVRITEALDPAFAICRPDYFNPCARGSRKDLVGNGYRLDWSREEFERAGGSAEFEWTHTQLTARLILGNRHTIRDRINEWGGVDFDVVADDLVEAGPEDLSLSEDWYTIQGWDSSKAEPRPLLCAIAQDLWECQRQKDVAKLCAYVGRPEVARKAAKQGIFRVPQILALA